MSPTDLSVYVHYPFCIAKCPYCDFYSGRPDDLGLEPNRYLDLVSRELEILARQDERLRGRRSRMVFTAFSGPAEWRT